MLGDRSKVLVVRSFVFGLPVLGAYASRRERIKNRDLGVVEMVVDLSGGTWPSAEGVFQEGKKRV